ELTAELEQWQTIQEILRKENYPDEIQQSTDTVIKSINIALTTTNTRSDSLYVIQKRQSQLIIFIDEVIRMLKAEQTILQSSYFIIDSKPIWSGIDSTNNMKYLRTELKKNLNENFDILKIYLRSNSSIVIIQLLFIIGLMIGFVLLGRMWPTDELDMNSRRETQAGIIIRHPFFSSLIISIMISIFFYSNRPLILGNFLLLLMIVSSAILLPILITKKIRIPVILLLVLFIINFIQDFIPDDSIPNRIFSLFQSIGIFFLLFFVFRIKNILRLRRIGERILKLFIIIFGLLMVIAFISNIIGSVKLSSFLLNSVIRTLSFSSVIVTGVIILNSMMILFIKGKRAQSIPMFEKLKSLIDKFIRPLINWGAFILWFIGTLIFFRLDRPFQNWIGNLMDTKFMISTVSISIGGIISFILIVFFTYIISRFVKNIFKDEWVSNSSLPRGTAEALSMLIRYVVVAFGVYLALGAIGVTMDKFGFMAGALGVGIGFGLQNVVLNFIAGLILSFEQPIHVGDVIEVDQDMGRVMEIGVRASKIMTWNGSEVIIPNGILISKRVINWTLTDEKRRLVIPIRTAFDANPKEVIEILKTVAGKHPNTLDFPAPMALFNGYGSSSLDFTFYCWVEFDVSLSTKSDIAVNAHEALAEAGIPVPLPVQKIQIDKKEDKHPAE
ncbi:MAG: mechanosensitive ion channel, partial [Bacteroidales bacterium]|nr:mechanosensitive ion channel [Bacteroidales bacterium]